MAALDLAIKGDRVFARATGEAMESRFFLNRYVNDVRLIVPMLVHAEPVAIS